MADDALAEANVLLAAYALAALRLAHWSGPEQVAKFEIFHIESETVVFGELIFRGVGYMQMPHRTEWGYRIRLAPDSVLPSRGDRDEGEVVYEFFCEDGAEPSSFVVAESLTVSSRAR